MPCKYEESDRKLTASFWHLQNYNDRLWPMIIFGSLMFIPGSYHVFLAVQTFRGVPGYLFDEYPTFDWFMVMISIFIFFKIISCYIDALWLYFLLARSINQFRNNGFEFSRNFDQFLCFFALIVRVFSFRQLSFLTNINNLSFFLFKWSKGTHVSLLSNVWFFIHFFAFLTIVRFIPFFVFWSKWPKTKKSAVLFIHFLLRK